MVQVVVAAVVLVVALVVAVVLRHRRPVAAPTQPKAIVPAQFDRADFPGEHRPWIVVIFSSGTCHTCADVVRKAAVLDSPEVAVIDVEWSAHRDLHRKYAIDAVPVVAVADAEGVVRRGFTGPVTATDLWAAVADARQPGSSPEPDLGN